jgi:hypothetical protein
MNRVYALLIKHLRGIFILAESTSDKKLRLTNEKPRIVY